MGKVCFDGLLRGALPGAERDRACKYNELRFCAAALLSCAMLEALLFSDMASVLTSMQSDVTEI